MLALSDSWRLRSWAALARTDGSAAGSRRVSVTDRHGRSYSDRNGRDIFHIWMTLSDCGDRSGGVQQELASRHCRVSGNRHYFIGGRM